MTDVRGFPVPYAFPGSGIFTAVLRENAANDPAGTAFSFASFADDAKEEGRVASVTRGELDSRARALAVLLQRNGAAGGSRVMLLMPSGLDFVTGISGSLYAGTCAVPVLPPAEHSGSSTGWQHIADVAYDSEPSVLVTTSQLASAAWDQLSRYGVRTLPTIEIETAAVSPEATAGWDPPVIKEDALAFLMYTSGSTGTPKGVMVSHENLASCLHALRTSIGLPVGGSVVSWVAPHRLVGLVYLLLSQFVGGHCRFMSPEDFASRPIRWLRAISQMPGPVVSTGPDFAYQLCAERIRPEERASLDLRRWIAAMSGGERNRPETLESFSQAFASSGFQRRSLRPAYGSTETLYVSSAPGSGPRILMVDGAELERGRAIQVRGEATPDTRVLVTCGQPARGTRVRIVNPDSLRVLPEDRVGELWISGSAVTQGYWRQERLTTELYRGYTSDTGEGPFLRSGDLAFLHDGELVVCGRSKEVIIVRGRNLYPEDVELACRDADPALASTQVVAFGADTGDEERLVIVAAAPPGIDDSELAGLATAIRRAIATGMAVDPYEVAIVPPGRIPQTRSGKPQRIACRDAYLAGQLAPLLALGTSRRSPRTTRGGPGPGLPHLAGLPGKLRGLPPDRLRVTLTSVVLAWIAEVTGSPQPVEDQPLVRLGIDSLRALELRYALERDFEVDLPAASFLEMSVGDIVTAMLGNLEGSKAGGERLPAVNPDADQRFAPFPLTDLQQAYFVGRTSGYGLGGVSCHGYSEFDTTQLDADRLRQSLQALIARHEMLRAVVSSDGTQRVLPEVPRVPVADYDMRNAGPQETAEHFQRVRDEMEQQVLPLDSWPLFDLRITLLPGGRFRIHIGLDLLIFDLWSIRLFYSEWEALYLEPDAILPRPRLSFRDYVLAARAVEHTSRYVRAQQYWKQRIATLPIGPELPLAQDPAMLERPRFRRRRATLDSAQWARLQQFSAAAAVTPTVALMAAYATVLGQWSKTKRFLLNIPTFNRLPLHEDVGSVIGDFTSVTLLEVDLAHDGGIASLARHLQRQLSEDLEHRYYSGVRVLRDLASEHRAPAAALAPFAFTSAGQGGGGQAELPTAWLGHQVYGVSQTPQVLLDHQVQEQEGRLVFNWDSVDEAFMPGVLDDMFTAYRGLLQRLAGDEGAWSPPTGSLLPARQQDLIASANATSGPLPDGLLFSGLQRQASHQPDKIAVTASDGSLTYRELYAHACSVGRKLRDLDIAKGELVGVALPKGAAQVVATIAVLLAGGTYLPIDPDLPPERKMHLIRHGQVRAVLVPPCGPSIPDSATNQLVEVDVTEPVAAEPWPMPVQHPSDLAYVLYTSGSSGEPKGVMISHRAALNTIDDINHRFQVGKEDVVLGLSSLSFDLSVYDIFGTLTAGATLVLPHPGSGREPAHWAELITTFQVTIWNSVPTLAQMLADHLMEARLPLRLVLLSGDWIPTPLPDQIRLLAPGSKVVSLGGATEAAIWSIAHEIGSVDPGWQSIPYGNPLRNQAFHVLNDRMQPCPIWVPGELFIGGMGLALGYWRDDDRTRASFVIHPGTGERLYRTGDLGRRLPDGAIEFLGREDSQVKIGGFRIELGEIEHVTNQHPAVVATVAAATGRDREHRRLVAYIQPGADKVSGTTPADVGRGRFADEVRRYLAARLPTYMVPSEVVVIDAIPLGRTGKVDRAALARRAQRDAEGAIHIGPANKAEETIASVVRQVLDVDEVGVQSDLFSLGATSLSIVKIQRGLRELGIEIPLRTLFRYPTVSYLAETPAPSGKDSSHGQKL